MTGSGSISLGGPAPSPLADDEEAPRASQRLRPILRYPDTTHADHSLEQLDQRDTHLALHHTFHVAWLFQHQLGAARGAAAYDVHQHDVSPVVATAQDLHPLHGGERKHLAH